MLLERPREPAVDVGRPVGVLQEVAALLELVEQRVAHREVGVLPQVRAEAELGEPADERGRVGVALRVPREVEARTPLVPRTSVEQQHLGRMTTLAKLLDDLERVLGGLVVGARHPHAVAPDRREARAAGEVGVAGDRVLRTVVRADEQVELGVLEVDEQRAVRPVRVAHAMRDGRRRVQEPPPARRAPRERGVLVGELGAEVRRVLVPAADALATPVEPGPLLTEAVHALSGRQLEGEEPAAVLASDRGEAQVTVDRAVLRRAEQHLAVALELDAERSGAHDERDVAAAHPQPRTARVLALLGRHGDVGARAVAVLGQDPVVRGRFVDEPADAERAWTVDGDGEPPAEHAHDDAVGSLGDHVERAQRLRTPDPGDPFMMTLHRAAPPVTTCVERPSARPRGH